MRAGPVFLACFAVAAAACRSGGDQPVIVQPGAPGQDARAIDADEIARQPQPRFTESDVAFMQGMIHHHAQALDMVELLKTRTQSGDMRKLALRIELSQRDEIQMMREWLADRGAAVPGEHAHHAPGAPLMPGMLTAEEMARLGAAKGPEFDRLFLEGMISHHRGAVDMAQTVARDGTDIRVSELSADVVAGQAAEVQRMRELLREL